jgi:hypothetical protein
VTTIKKAWSKPFRKKLPTGDTVPLDAYWAATFTTANLDAIVALRDDPDAAIALICGAGRRTLNAAGNRGTGVHTVLETLAGGVDPDTLLVGSEVAPFVPACAAFLNDWHPEWIATEFVAINRTLGFGGTGDAILALTPPWGGRYACVTDWKSRGGQHGCYEEEVAQIGGYTLAEYIIVEGPDSRPVRMPLPDLDGGLVVSLTATGYEAYPVDLELAQDAFRAMYDSWHCHRDGQQAARKARQQPLMVASASLHLVTDPEQAYLALLDRTEWVRSRVDAIKAAGQDARTALALEWSAHPDVPTFPKGGPNFDEQVTRIAQMCDRVEAEYGIPFGESDPTIPKQTKTQRKPTA